MSLFKIFRKKNISSSAKDDFIKAKEHFDNGDFEETMRTLIWGFKRDVNHKALYKLASDTLGKLNFLEEQKLFLAVCDSIKDSEAFYNLGNFYFKIENYDLAQKFYEKTIELNPKNEDAIHNLAISYARRFQINKAIEVLIKFNTNDFWDLYFLTKCKILANKVVGIQKSIDNLQFIINNQPNTDDITVPRMKLNELQETLQRYYTIPDIQIHIRDWQFIQYGGVILDYSEDGDDYVAGGRYVSCFGSYQSIKNISIKLIQFTEKLSITFKGIASLRDKNSEIIGRLLAKEFGLEFNFYDNSSTNQNCLIVSSDSSLFAEHEELNIIQKDQVLFSLNHSWLKSSYISSDIIGFMTQSYSFPWSGDSMQIIDLETRNIKNLPIDNRSAEEIANDIYIIDQEPEEIGNYLDFYYERKDFLKGIGKKTNNLRYNFMIESPVPGSFFI